MSEDYEVGYGKPPEEHRFKKGQSGNPSGRPKGSRSIYAIADAVLSRRVTVKEHGRTRTVTVTEAMVLAMAHRAAKGDHRAFKVLEPYLPQEEPEEIEEAAQPVTFTLSMGDPIIQERIVEAQRREREREKPEGKE
ncbi:MAG: DUF5681 domain-containing protein [Sphingomonas sp.]|uniref:DUF5681 domain-containing protein n=1 Tax=Sphingomonas sp. TaxID=28214 RepID=UPI003F810B33